MTSHVARHPAGDEAVLASLHRDLKGRLLLVQSGAQKLFHAQGVNVHEVEARLRGRMGELVEEFVSSLPPEFYDEETCAAAQKLCLNKIERINARNFSEFNPVDFCENLVNKVKH